MANDGEGSSGVPGGGEYQLRVMVWFSGLTRAVGYQSAKVSNQSAMVCYGQISIGYGLPPVGYDLPVVQYRQLTSVIDQLQLAMVNYRLSASYARLSIG